MVVTKGLWSACVYAIIGAGTLLLVQYIFIDRDGVQGI